MERMRGNNHGGERERFLVSLLVFLSSLVTLFVEMIEPKLFQFLKVFGHEMGVVAVAMLGLGVAGLLSFYLGPKNRQVTALAALGLGPAVVLSFFVTVLAPNSPLSARSEFWRLAMAAVTALFCALPYLAAGLITAAAYIRYSSFRVYGLSLFGSALGIVLTYVCLPKLGAEASLLAAAALAALAAAAIAPALAQNSSRFRFRSLGRAGLLVCASLLILHLATNCFDVLRLSPRHPRARELSEPGQFATEARGFPGARVLASRWSAISRVDALSTPSLTMEMLAYPRGQIAQQVSNPLLKAEIAESFQTTHHLYSNNVWFSSMPQRAPLPSRLAPYTLLEHPRVLVIGVGGGIDLARALALEPRRLVGVEINPATVELMRGPLAAVSADIYHRAEVLTMDGRSYVHRSPEKYDLINLVFADLYIPFHNSNIFLESYLYTLEGFQDYLRLLADPGFLAVTKMVGSLQAPTELLRITATALQASRNLGLESPEQNLVVIGFSSGQLNVYGGTLLVKKTAFRPAELTEIRSELSPPLFALYLPGDTGRANPFQELITAADPQAFYRAYPLNIEPTTDNQPFFYLFDRSLALHRNAVLFFLGLTVLFFFLPLGLIIARRQRFREPAFLVGPPIIALLALGYFFVESALIQKLNLYLGGPLYSLSTVTAAFLFYPGLVALLASRLSRTWHRRLLFTPALVLLLYEPLLDWLTGFLPASSPALRMITVFLLLAPLCLPLGLPFPHLLDELKRRTGEQSTGLFYGVSAMAGVVTVSLALYWSARFGLHSLFLAGAAAYLIVPLLALIIFARDAKAPRPREDGAAP